MDPNSDWLAYAFVAGLVVVGLVGMVTVGSLVGGSAYVLHRLRLPKLLIAAVLASIVMGVRYLAATLFLPTAVCFVLNVTFSPFIVIYSYGLSIGVPIPMITAVLWLATTVLAYFALKQAFPTTPGSQAG
ncbi:MAG: hypothetical protein K0U74_15740 [Alphaproteobacteria bacterium]|nr:hypothetical protein [Alphaproteobacteria bacterium]